MKKSCSFTIVLFSMASILFYACGNKHTSQQNTSGTVTATPSDSLKVKAIQDLTTANNQFYDALNAMFTGELGPMDSIWSHSKDVTDMGPFGARITGWDSVNAEFKKEAGLKLGGKVICKNLLVQVGTDMGYSVCVEEGQNMSADGKHVIVSHRATNIFRLENGKWK